MSVRVLFKDKSIKDYLGIRRVYNQSTELDTDTLCIEKFTDIKGKPSYCIPLNTIICFEVEY